MECKINTQVLLSTGEPVIGAIVRFANGAIDLDTATYSAQLEVSRSQADKDDNRQVVGVIVDDEVVTRCVYNIPQDDIAEVVSSGEYTVIGEHQRAGMLSTLALAFGIAEEDIEVTTML